MSDKKSDPVDDKRVVCGGFCIFALEEKTQVAWRLSNWYQDISEGWKISDWFEETFYLRNFFSSEWAITVDVKKPVGLIGCLTILIKHLHFEISNDSVR